MPFGPWNILRQRDFALVWAASALSGLGAWMQIATLGIYVTESTGGARLTGIASTVTYIALGLTPIGGVLADRFDRKRVLAATSVGQGLVGGLMAACFGFGIESPPLLIALAGLQGLFGAAGIPALFAMVADIVPAHRLGNATLLDQIAWNAGRSLGPVVAVAVIHGHSYATVFAVNAISCAVLALMLPFIRVVHVRHDEGGSLTTRLRVGWQAARDTELCRWPIALVLIDMALIAPFIALIPVMGVITLHEGASGTAALFVAQGVGSVVGALIVGSVMHRFGQGKSFVALSCVAPVLLVAYALSPSLWVAVLLIMPLSAAHTSNFSLSGALVQRFSAPQVRARVLGIHSSVTGLSYAATSTVLAVLADVVGLRATLLIGASTAVVSLVLLVVGPTDRLALISRSDRATPEDKSDVLEPA